MSKAAQIAEGTLDPPKYIEAAIEDVRERVAARHAWNLENGWDGDPLTGPQHVRYEAIDHEYIEISQEHPDAPVIIRHRPDLGVHGPASSHPDTMRKWYEENTELVAAARTATMAREKKLRDAGRIAEFDAPAVFAEELAKLQ